VLTVELHDDLAYSIRLNQRMRGRKRLPFEQFPLLVVGRILEMLGSREVSRFRPSTTDTSKWRMYL